MGLLGHALLKAALFASYCGVAATIGKLMVSVREAHSHLKGSLIAEDTVFLLYCLIFN